MINFSNVPYDEFKELVQFLKFNDEEGEFHNITKRLTRFIPNMNAMQSLAIDDIIKNILEENDEEAKKGLEEFKQQYPDTQIDPEGKLDMTDFNYYEISLQSCDLLYNQSVEKINEGVADDIDRQIYNAKTLEPLKAMTGKYAYPMKRVLYFKQDKARPLTLDELKDAEKKVKELFPEENGIMDKFMNFIYSKKYEKCSFFVEHFLQRLDVLSKDKELTHPSNKEFYDNLKQL